VDEAKPFKIAKREVWEAFKSVQAYQGAAGVRTVASLRHRQTNEGWRLNSALLGYSRFQAKRGTCRRLGISAPCEKG
jgi:hypothetical protein